MNKAINIDSVYLSFQERNILKGATLNLKQGIVTGILGRNGCGKSCFLKIIIGQLIPQNKHIKYDHKSYQSLYNIKGLINYLPQHEFHPKSLYIHQLLDFYNINKQDFLEKYPFLGKQINRRFLELSGGEKRLIEVLLILEAPTKFSILDEPFSHIMPKHVQLVKESITSQRQQKGILLTDHQYQNVIDISEELFLLKDGIFNKVEGIDDLKKHSYI